VSDRFKRTYAVEIEFDTPIDFAEQDRLACVVLEKLVSDYWTSGARILRKSTNPLR